MLCMMMAKIFKPVLFLVLVCMHYTVRSQNLEGIWLAKAREKIIEVKIDGEWLTQRVLKYDLTPLKEGQQKTRTTKIAEQIRMGDGSTKYILDKKDHFIVLRIISKNNKLVSVPDSTHYSSVAEAKNSVKPSDSLGLVFYRLSDIERMKLFRSIESMTKDEFVVIVRDYQTRLGFMKNQTWIKDMGYSIFSYNSNVMAEILLENKFNPLTNVEEQFNNYHKKYQSDPEVQKIFTGLKK